YFDGLISGARVWSVVRPSEEIYAGMDGQFGPGEAGLISNWPMNEGQGQVAGDMTGRSLGYLGTNGNVETRDPAWYDAWGVSKKQYIITATAGPNGTITPSNKVNYVEEGGSAAFTITPSQNLRIQDVLVDGTSVGAVPSYTFTNVTTNRSIEAYFSSPIEELPTTNALQFDGVDDVVIFENASGFNLYSAMPFTLEAWVKADEKVTGNHIVIAKQDTTIGTRGYYLMINDEENDQFSFFMMADSTHYLHVDGGVDVIDGQWHHVAVTYDGNGGSGIKLYVDGAEDPLTTVVFDNIGTNSMDNNVPLTIGTRNNNTSDVAFDGLIDEVRFWSDVRTAQEVSDNMNILVQGNEAGLAGNWRMDEGNGQIAWDNAGNSNGRLGDTNAVDGNDPVWVDFTGSFGLQLVVMTNISSGGTMYPDYPLMVDTGSVITYAIIPDAGYDIESVTGCGGILVTDNSFVTDAITADCTVTASFTDLAHTVTATAGAGGTITPAQATVVYGNATSFLIEPDIGNHLLSVESDCGGGLVGNTYITGPVTAECQLSASFGNNLNVNTVPQDGGTVASLPAGIDCGINCSAAFTHGSSVSLTAVPGTGSVFTGWNGGGCSGTGNCTVTLNADTTVTASFNYTDQLVRIGGTTPIYFTSIQAAYEHAHTEGMSAVTIQMKMTGLTEIVNLNWPISVTLEGGYNSDYSSVAGVTTLYGDITLNNGTLTIENIEISP
ncbi:MAG: LamG domain-containing protein, partial [Deltaproteobacteria bacterium]|nr:LamG domain-containing protein [Deltaproteobacteria bacterium]